MTDMMRNQDLNLNGNIIKPDLVLIREMVPDKVNGGNFIDKKGLHGFAGGKHYVLLSARPNIIYLFGTVYKFSSTF